MHAQEIRRSSLPPPISQTNIQKRFVRFSDVIRYSDNEIGYLLDYEDDDIFSTCGDDESRSEEGHTSRWSTEDQLSPSRPLRRGSFLNTSAASADPPSPPMRRHSILASMGNTSDHETEAEDDSILNSPQYNSLDISARSVESLESRTPRGWLQLASGGIGCCSPPVVPTRRLSGNDVAKTSKETPADCGNHRWNLDIPPPLSTE